MKSLNVFAAALVVVFAFLAACGDEKGAAPQEKPRPPVGTLEVTDSRIRPGEVTTLSWRVIGAEEVRLFLPDMLSDGDEASTEMGEAVYPIGGRQISPRRTTPYALYIRGEGGEAVLQVTVWVSYDYPPNHEDGPIVVIHPTPDPTDEPDPTVTPTPTPTPYETPEPTVVSQPPTPRPPYQVAPPGCTRVGSRAVMVLELSHAPYYWETLNWGLNIRSGAVARNADNIGTIGGAVWNCSSGNWDDRYPEAAPTRVCVALQSGPFDLEWDAGLMAIPGYGNVPTDVVVSAEVYRLSEANQPVGQEYWSSGAFSLLGKRRLGEFRSTSWCE